MATKRGGIGLLIAPEEPEDEFVEDEFDGDLDSMGLSTAGDPDVEGGAFEAYADTVFNPEASLEERSSALREAILTLVEEQR
jgi:hypothetical protein